MAAHRFSLCTNWLPVVLLMLLGVLGTACEDAARPDHYVARVGDAYLMQNELDEMVETLSDRQDSLEVRRQFINQWVRNELLYQEALRQNLLNDPDVQRRLRDSERSVLIDALVARLYAQEPDPFSRSSIRSYYERNKEQLALREPFVRVRYLSASHADSTAAARQALQQAVIAAEADSLWPRIVERYATDVEGSLSLADNYFPESRLFTGQPILREHLRRLRSDEIAPVVEYGDAWHVLNLVARVPAGTIPELTWVEEEVQRLLLIDARKQMYERQVQRLRTEAQARDALEIH